MTKKIDAAEIDRILKPGNLGVRLFVAIGRAIPESTFPKWSEEEIINETRQMDEEERQEAIEVIRIMEQTVAAIIVERGGCAPELVRS